MSSYKNASIGTSIERNDASIYMSIERNDTMIDYKDALIEFIVQKEKATEISKKDAEDANKIVRELDIMQVIGSADVMKILDCKTTKARQVLKMMENNEILKPVHGMGKGKYMLNVHD